MSTDNCSQCATVNDIHDDEHCSQECSNNDILSNINFNTLKIILIVLLSISFVSFCFWFASEKSSKHKSKKKFDV